MKEKIRIAKFLASAGVASRRKAEEIISAGKVKINNKVVKDLATKVDENCSDITVNNKKVILDKKVYYLLNKPVGYICSVSDPHNKETVLDLVPKEPKVWPVGRLDKNSQGLLLLTNDGDLTYKLTHPKFEVKKTYLVKIDKHLDKDISTKLLAGVKLEEGLAKADKAVVKDKKTIEIIIHQGWKRQIRRMLETLGYQTISLTRIAEGKLKLNSLAVAKYKILSKEDIL